MHVRNCLFNVFEFLGDDHEAFLDFKVYVHICALQLYEIV